MQVDDILKGTNGSMGLLGSISFSSKFLDDNFYTLSPKIDVSLIMGLGRPLNQFFYLMGLTLK